MLRGPICEVAGTTSTIDLSDYARSVRSKVIAPRNPKLVHIDEINCKVTPSHFLFDMKLTTDQKLANTHVMHLPQKVELLDMGDTSLQRVDIDEPLFQPFPSEIYFQNYEAFETYQVPLVLRNNDKVPRLVKVTQNHSPYFKIISPSNVGHKVGPGLAITIYIQFLPNEKKDYRHDLICHTEREKFIVPVYATGVRGILDFPDEIHFSVCPVKYSNTKSLLIRNIGNGDAKFKLEVKGQPAHKQSFSVSPELGTLAFNDIMQVHVVFNASNVGNHRSELIVTYDTGEAVSVGLYGASDEIAVKLDTDCLPMNSTYISMASERSVRICNRSDIIVHFRWSNYATGDEEELRKSVQCSEIDCQKESDTDRFLSECIQDPTLRDKIAMLSRAFTNRKRMVEKDAIIFEDDVFKIEPPEGDVWPNSTFEVNVVFKPNEAIFHSRTVFCDVSGRQCRLPLKICGDGIGPRVEFSYEDLDMGNIFIGSTHTYEVHFANKGDIDAIYNVVANTSTFGHCFSFNPEQGIVLPGGHQAIFISFCSSSLGDFAETFLFLVDGSPDEHTVTFRGSVIGPTCQFDIPELKFGTVSYGFKNKQSCRLMNTSLVSMSFHLRIPGDGTTTSSICATDDLDFDTSSVCMATTPHHGLTGHSIKEFDVQPSTGMILPQCDIVIDVTMTSNQVRTYNDVLTVDIDGVSSDILCLPVTARCALPIVSMMSQVLQCNRCFLRYPYNVSVCLRNESDLPAKYIVLPQEELGMINPPILYRSPSPKGVIAPNSMCNVPLIISVHCLEEQSIPCLVAIFGSEDPPLQVNVMCVGEGPVVHMTPSRLDWGTIPVLLDVSLCVTLSNESLIPSEFTARMVRLHSVFRVVPEKCVIPPESSLKLSITAHLDDCVRFQDKLELNFVESLSRTVSLTAFGQGTTIVSDPPLTPNMTLGPCFSNRLLVKTFRLTNKGRRHQQLMWSTERVSSAMSPQISKTLLTPWKSVFALSPNRFDLQPGESTSFNIEANVAEPCLVHEHVICHAILGRQGGKEMIIYVDLTVEFISPLLELSAKSVFFIVEKNIGDELKPETKSLNMTNVSSLPLTAILTTKFPFYILLSSGAQVDSAVEHLECGQQYHLTILFDPAFKDDLHSRTIDESLCIAYEEHPHTDYVTLRGEVFFPNLLFEKTAMDFGCILNDTEVTRYINIVNNSPLQVRYSWSFFEGNSPMQVKRTTALISNDDEERESKKDVNPEIMAQEVDEMEEKIGDDTLSKDDHKYMDVSLDNCLHGNEQNEGEYIDVSEISKQCNVDINEDSGNLSYHSASCGSEIYEKGRQEQVDCVDEGSDGEHPISNTQLCLLAEEEALTSNQVFDILPLYGVLEPEESEQVTFTFFGHSYVFSETKAMCTVEGGPTYHVSIAGQASSVEYYFDRTDIDLGQQMYDAVAVEELILVNSGKVAFAFSYLSTVSPANCMEQADLVLLPADGVVEPFSKQQLLVRFYPKFPEKFSRMFSIQVAHFQPDVFHLHGEGIFPHVSLDLPRLNDASGYYDVLLENAKNNLDYECRKRSEDDDVTVDCDLQAMNVSAEHVDDSNRLLYEDGHFVTELDVQMEVERLAVKDFVQCFMKSPSDTVQCSGESQQPFTLRALRCDESLAENYISSAQIRHSVNVAGDFPFLTHKKAKPRLPEYLLDFGYVVLGTQCTHVVHATNTGCCPVSFKIERRSVQKIGFFIELEKVRNLPGAPDHETIDFAVTFDPRAANLQLGPVQGVVQINNQRHVPMHLRRKMLQKRNPPCFEVLPPNGDLYSGQRFNIQVKFMPTEEKKYEHRIPIKIAQSNRRIVLLCRGQGMEPRMEFSRQLVEFVPVLPHSNGDEEDVVVSNPCSFPIEIYNLEYDRLFLEEEKVLRLMRGYDEYNTLLLPPCLPGEKLPIELIDFYDEQLKRLQEVDRSQQVLSSQAEDGADQEEHRKTSAEIDVTISLPAQDCSSTTSHKRDFHEDLLQESSERNDFEMKEDALEARLMANASSGVSVGDLEVTPVSASIARHLGIDLSNEGQAARNRRGIAIVINGTPLSGKTQTAVMLARHFDAAILTLDGVVMDSIHNGNTEAGIRARQLCGEAARRNTEETKWTEVEGSEKKVAGLSVEALTAHTQLGNVTSGSLQALSRKVSTITDVKAKERGGKAVTCSVEGGTGSQMPSSPPPLAGPVARRLSVDASVTGGEGLLSCVLPEELLVEILADRLQLNDCHRGVVFDGLETLFAQNLFSAVNAVLRAMNNRRFIFFCTIKLDYSMLKEKKKKELLEKELAAKRSEEMEMIRLEEMDEEEYDALGEDEKARMDEKRLVIKKQRIKREQEEREEKERLAREAREEEERIRLEEMRKSKGRRKQVEAKDGKDKEKKAGQSTSDRTQKTQTGSKHDADNKRSSSIDRPESHQTVKSDEDGNLAKRRQSQHIVDLEHRKRKAGKDGKKQDGKGLREEDIQSEEYLTIDPVKEAEMLLLQRFRTFEHSLKDISDLLEVWDRTTLQIRRPRTPSERSEEEHGKDQPASGRKGKGKGDKHDKEREKQRQVEKELAEKVAKEIALAEETLDGYDGDSTSKEEELFGVPHIVIDCADCDGPIHRKILDTNRLPSTEDVMDGLGLGPHGPPIPQMTNFSVMPYPVRRRAPAVTECGRHYVFIASSPDDPNVIVEEKAKEADLDDDKSVTPDKSSRDDAASRAKTKASSKSGGGVQGADTPKPERKRSADRKYRLNRRSSTQATPPPGTVTPVVEEENKKLNVFRWVIPPRGVTTLRLRFKSHDLGQFDQTFNFEIVGTRRRYQLFCRGICAFPTISREPRVVFPLRKKDRNSDEIVHKKFILRTDVFEFGPLLVGKNRERYKEGRYPENTEKFTVLNSSPLESDVSFCFLNDSKAETFLLEPESACLKPGQSIPLTVWAYPKGPGRYDDAVVCCVRDNPEPVIFKLACEGFRPELELDRKQIHFDKVLIHRKDTKTLFLRNSTQLPVSWKISGLENLGDDFTMSAINGVVEPLSEYPLHAYFRAVKPVQASKRVIRLELLDVRFSGLARHLLGTDMWSNNQLCGKHPVISDSENIMGVVSTEVIQVIAEAYDVALDMSFPKGTDGGLDFGTIRVNEERKEICTLKNKGKYDISFSFAVENCDAENRNVASLFTVTPNKATLSPMDRPTQVQVAFRAPHEVAVRDQPVLRCHVIEPSLGDGGEVIAKIPVKVSVRSVFSRFSLVPATDINFGTLLVNSRKTRTFTISNCGEFDFRYTISKVARDSHGQSNVRHLRPAVKVDKRDGSSSGRSAVGTKKAESLRQDAVGVQSRLIVGMFTVFPAFGVIQPNSHQNITVECVTEIACRSSEDLCIDITDLDPKSIPGGIQYKLMAESSVPSIDVSDIGSIFEEHRICKSLSTWQQFMDWDSGGVYGEEEKKFVFNNVIVGKKAKARFKISNITKVPCDVVFLLRPVSTKGAVKPQDIFDVDPPRAHIANHSFLYATITFSPPSMQTYSAMFEAAIDGLTQNQARGRSLLFEVTGDGNLPRVTVTKPTVRNRQGQPLLLFRKILLGTCESLPLELRNDGALPSQVDIDLMDPDNAFTLQQVADSQNTFGPVQRVSTRRLHTASVVIMPGEVTVFGVSYTPAEAHRSQANIRLSVLDNQYEDTMLQLVGEGYVDDITLDNITKPTHLHINPEVEEVLMADDDVAAKSNLMMFGDCYIGEEKTLSLTLTNHSQSDCVRFSWPHHPLLRFSPQVGHLHAGCAKDVSISFLTDVPMKLVEEVVEVPIVKIMFDKPTDISLDWDDRVKSIKWVDVRQSPAPTTDSVQKLPSDRCLSANPQSTVSRPMMKKVVEVEREPSCCELVESARSICLVVSAVADFCQSTCNTSLVHYKDTLLFQTRVYKVILRNTGPVMLEYSWQVVMDSLISPPCFQRSVTFLSETDRPESRVDVVESAYVPFSVEPECGLILPNKQASCIVKFSPLDVNEHEGRQFNIINPTDEKYHFGWICDDDVSARSPSPFRCLNLKGDILSGRKYKVGFEFTSNQLDIAESFWHFIITQQNISVPFLLVGTTSEPDVTMDRSHVNFKSLLIGCEAMETIYIVNNENTSFGFHFVNDSCHSDGYTSHLSVEPSFGQLTSKSRTAVNLRFVPTSEKEVNFNVVCKVDGRLSPLTLNVKAEGYAMNCILLCEDSSGKKEPFTSRHINRVDFGSVEVKERVSRQLSLLNTGKFDFDFTVHLTSADAGKLDAVAVDPTRGSVARGTTEQCCLSFCPPALISLHDCQLKLKVSNGPTYVISVLGQGVSPVLNFSFLSHNFGYCFVHHAGMAASMVTLKLTNKDKKDISVDCTYKSTAQLQHQFVARVMRAGESVDVPFSFLPRDSRRYREVVTFDMNALSQQSVEFIGTGCQFKVSAADNCDRVVNLGVRRIGDVVKKRIPIANHSLAPVTFNLAFTPSSRSLHNLHVLAVSPTGPISLSARGGTTKVEIVFRPKFRVPSFTEEVLMESVGMSQPLLIIRGSCLGMEVTLDSDYVPFGTVYLRSQTSRRLSMTNSGDMNTKFKWDVSRFFPDFDIAPVDGYITSGTTVTFDVTFHPQAVNHDIRYEKLRCFLDGGGGGASCNQVVLTLTGSCTSIPPVKEVQSFCCVTRGQDCRTIAIPNRSNQNWTISPVIDGEYWSGPVTLDVESQQTKHFELTYRPLTMTTENRKHQGSIFFPLPDGTGLLFNLVGTAEPPKPSGRIQRDVECKAGHGEHLSVTNWLKTPQRFHVKIEPIKPDKLDAGTSVKGMDYIDVSANSTKDYILNVYAYREGQFVLKVTFTNDRTGEYQFYEVQLRFTKPGVISTIDLLTPVRQSKSHSICLENPLNYPVTFSASCNISEILMPTSLNVPARSSGQVNCEYHPLKVGDVQGRIEFHCNDLGQFFYDLNLHATAAGPEKAICMRAFLGQSHVQTARFLNFSKQKTDYSCKVDNADFHVDKTVAAAPSSTCGTEVALDVTFEPSHLGEQRGMLTVTSPVGGEYTFPLYGTCKPSKPQGPFIVKAGSSTPVIFRNVFPSTTAFTFKVDNPLFHLPKQGETIRPKKDHRIVVGFDGTDTASKATVMGKLTVSCVKSAGSGGPCMQWMYYLKGVTQ